MIWRRVLAFVLFREIGVVPPSGGSAFSGLLYKSFQFNVSSTFCRSAFPLVYLLICILQITNYQP